MPGRVATVAVLAAALASSVCVCAADQLLIALGDGAPNGQSLILQELDFPDEAEGGHNGTRAPGPTAQPSHTQLYSLQDPRRWPYPHNCPNTTGGHPQSCNSVTAVAFDGITGTCVFALNRRGVGSLLMAGVLEVNAGRATGQWHVRPVKVYETSTPALPDPTMTDITGITLYYDNPTKNVPPGPLRMAWTEYDQAGSGTVRFTPQGFNASATPPQQLDTPKLVGTSVHQGWGDPRSITAYYDIIHNVQLLVVVDADSTGAGIWTWNPKNGNPRAEVVPATTVPRPTMAVSAAVTACGCVYYADTASIYRYANMGEAEAPCQDVTGVQKLADSEGYSTTVFRVAVALDRPVACHATGQPTGMIGWLSKWYHKQSNNGMVFVGHVSDAQSNTTAPAIYTNPASQMTTPMTGHPHSYPNDLAWIVSQS